MFRYQLTGRLFDNVMKTYKNVTHLPGFISVIGIQFTFMNYKFKISFNDICTLLCLAVGSIREELSYFGGEEYYQKWGVQIN